jgi:hypothetical protein
MGNKNINRGVVVIDDSLISQAILAIESDEPTPEEREADQLAKLIPSIRAAMDRGESHERIRKKVKSIIPALHYTKVNGLLAAAATLVSDQHERADQLLSYAQ